jgi:obg-like ATPase 1
MPPKKKEEEKPRIKGGRVSNSLKMGLVGLPNVGKSLTFNILTRLTVPSANYPFCTIDPHEAVVEVPDERFSWLSTAFRPGSNVRSVLKIWDIAGLVPNAHKGEGLGNAFLSNIQSVDGIYHVCRAFDEEDVLHTEGEVNPVRDLEIIRNELVQKDVAFCSGKVDEAQKKHKAAPKDKERKEELDTLLKVQKILEDGKTIRSSEDWSAKEVEVINRCQFLTTKPVVYLVNMSEKDYVRQRNKWLAPINEWVSSNGGGPIIPYSAQFEARLVEVADLEERKKLMEDLGAKKSMIDKIITTGYEHLDLIHFFTVGPEEVRSWTIPRGAKAPEAAGTIHSDMERGFICAEIYKFEDIKEAGSEAQVKANGKLQQCGKTYEMQDGDICFFKFNVTTAAKK